VECCKFSVTLRGMLRYMYHAASAIGLALALCCLERHP